MARQGWQQSCFSAARMQSQPTLPSIRIILLGPPGSGKGTQAKLLASHFGISAISTGEILRTQVRAGTSLGQKVRAGMERGELISDELVISLMSTELGRPGLERGYVLDGFPRNVYQARAMDLLVTPFAPIVIVKIEVPEGELIRRLAGRRVCTQCQSNASSAGADTDQCAQCGGRLELRADDRAEEIQRHRLAVYNREAVSVEEYYAFWPTFASVDGTRSVEAVSADLVRAVERLLPARREVSRLDPVQRADIP
jgi:adenylate kinase